MSTVSTFKSTNHPYTACHYQGKVVDITRARLVTGRERLQIHGFPPQWFRDPETQARIETGEFSDSFLCDLAGNSFVAFQFMAVTISVLANWPSGDLAPRVEPSGDDDDENALLDAMCSGTGACTSVG